MLKSNKLKIIILTFLLFIIPFIFILINGRTYIYKVQINQNVKNIDEIVIEVDQDKEIIEILNKEIDNGILKLELKSISKGKVFINVNYSDLSYLEAFYVHNFGIITQDHYFGRSSGDIIIPICLLLYIVSILYILIIEYKRNINDNIYQYKNITYLGVIIFLIFNLLDRIFGLTSYSGLINSIQDIVGSVQYFSVVTLPIAVIAFIFVTISNIVLLKREGFTWKNTLGTILGVLLIVVTFIPELFSNIFNDSTWINLHNENGIGLYIYTFFETFIYLIVSYIECILLGTIILVIKSSKRIPKFNKDYIIILGCMIKKDGSLTPLLKSRVERAIEFAKMQKLHTGKDIIFIPSGGKGNDEIISEAEAMEKYLIKQGISKKNILIENKSTSTYENINFSNNIIKEKNKDAKIAFSTTNYHVFRSGIIASNQGVSVEGIGSKTKSYFWINAFIREFIATLYSEKKRHLIIILYIVLFSIIMISIMYLSAVA